MADLSAERRAEIEAFFSVDKPTGTWSRSAVIDLLATIDALTADNDALRSTIVEPAGYAVGDWFTIADDVMERPADDGPHQVTGVIADDIIDGLVSDDLLRFQADDGREWSVRAEHCLPAVVADREPEGHLSAERLATIRWRINSTRDVCSCHCEDARDLLAENDALRSTIVDLEAERDRPDPRRWVSVEDANRVLAEERAAHEATAARAAADTPKRQADRRIKEAATEVINLWNVGGPTCAGMVRLLGELDAALAAAFTEEPAAPKETP